MRKSVWMLVLALAAPALAAPDPRLAVGVQPWLELEGALQQIAASSPTPAGFTPRDTEYTRELARILAPFKEHPATLLRRGPEYAGFDFGERAQLLLRLSAAPELSTDVGRYAGQFWPGGSAEQLERCAKSLRDFARDSRFMESFPAAAKHLEPELNRLRRQAQAEDWIRRLEDYAGLPFEGRFAIWLSPFHAPGGAASWVPEPEEEAAVSAVIGPKLPDGEPRSYVRHVAAALWHELAHRVLDSAAELHASELARREGLQRELGWPCYGDWRNCFKEHAARSLMLRLVSSRYGEAAALEQLRAEGEDKFPYLKPMLAALGEYERERERHPNLLDFYARLIEALPPPKEAAQAGFYPGWLAACDQAFPGPAARKRALSNLNRMAPGSGGAERYLRRAALQYRLGEAEAAQADAREALRLSPGDPRARMLSALALAAQGELDAARRELEPARLACAGSVPVEREPDCRALGSWLLAPEGERFVEKRLSPEELARGAAYHRDLGVAYYMAGKAGPALEELERALRLDPFDAGALISRGVALQALKREEKALASYERALRLLKGESSEPARRALADALSSRASLLAGRRGRTRLEP